ncbi:MAG: KOW domain-containing RNA-binding protein [Eubacteriales bacterium]|jgi:large subunit ribosomal protein L14e|nr:KOW domain-containing protein [Clostridiales bacterium]
MTKKSTHKSKLNAKDMSINIDVSADCIGEVVLSLRGRDSKRRFVIIGAAAEVGYVYVADGRLRKVESPKKKKRKHLLTEGMATPEIVDAIRCGSITNKKLWKFIRSSSNDTDSEIFVDTQ